MKLSYAHFIWRMTCILALPLAFQCGWEEPACARAWSPSIFCIYFTNFPIVHFFKIFSTYPNNLNLFLFNSSPPLSHFQWFSCRFYFPVLCGFKTSLYPFPRIYVLIKVAFLTICWHYSPKSGPSLSHFVRKLLVKKLSL